MADTVVVDLSSTEWTEMTSASSGFITNETVYKVTYREASSLPASTVTTGHTLENEPGSFFQFTLADGQELYGRSVGGAGRVAITPGDD